MNPNESFLSTISTTNAGTPAMARIMANVVDMQQHLVSQYQTVVNALDSLKLEVHNSTQSIREDLRRTDDRAQKQVDDLRITHANEVTRLMELIKMLVQVKDQSSSAPQSQSAQPEAPRMTPAQMAYANAVPPSSFFGPSTGSFNDLAAQAQAHYAACYLQQLQEQQRMRSAGMQATGFFGNQPANMGGVGIPGAFPQSQHTASVAPVGAVPAPKPPVAAPLGTVPPVTAAPPIPPSNTGLPITFGSSASTATSTSSITSASSQAPANVTSSGLFMGAAKPPVTVSLPLSSPAQPPKSEAPKAPETQVKSEATPQTTPFSFAAPKYASPATTATLTSEAAKPTPNIFSGIKPAENIFSKTPEVKPRKEGDGVEDDDHDHVEEFEPQVDFKPVCPLPELVKVVTGEEDEKVIFEERCKLYRYSDETKEWKERGTGVMKVLENTNTKKCRVVMRREQVFKVCANHQLLPGMTIQAMPRQEKAMMWYCEDFSEDQKTHEKLSARFANVEVANRFKEVFENAVKNAGEAPSPVKPTKTEKQVDKGTTSNTEEVNEKKTEAKKEEKEPDSKETTSQKGYGDQFKLQPGQWECPECYSRTAEDKCPCCGTPKEGEKAPTATSKSTLPTSSIPLGGAPTSESQKFTFGLSAAAAAKASPAVSTSSSTSNTPKSSLFGASLATAPSTTPSGGFTFGAKPSIFGGASAKPSAEGTSPLPSFSFTKKSESAAAPTSTAVTSSSTPVTFSFKTAGTSSTTPSMGSSLFGSKLFGASSAASTEEKKEQEKEDKDAAQPKAEQKVFGSGFGGNLSFASLAKSASGSIFDPANTQKAQAEFAAQAKSKAGVICFDYSESPDGADEIFTAKFKTPEIAKEFHDKFVEAAASHPVKCRQIVDWDYL
ncbi:hypothetical protein GCK32_008702 [Trichostrongylus colubriformis]|uniref:RanBD1 domain-containing protein n=1 Tax=Trichostrongylus colubriformis TaxID=6319 RepID=A0AAN8IPJ7_TRICO